MVEKNMYIEEDPLQGIDTNKNSINYENKKIKKKKKKPKNSTTIGADGELISQE